MMSLPREIKEFLDQQEILEPAFDGPCLFDPSDDELFIDDDTADMLEELNDY